MATNKEYIEKESKTDIAYRVLLKKKKERSFYDIWEEVKEELLKVVTDPEEREKILNDEDISFFYTNLTLDSRFVCVGDNKWTLRERVTFDKVHIDMNEIYAEEEEDSESENEENVDDTDVVDDYDESYDDSTGTDADLIKYNATIEEEEE